MAEQKKKMGRPPIPIDWKKVETLCQIQCTQEEIVSVMEISLDTLCYQSKKLFGTTFAEVYKKWREGGKCSIRRAQYKKALEGNPAMLIWMGKQVLGQREQLEFSGANPIALAYDPNNVLPDEK